MSESLSQDDLDALFGELSGPETVPGTEKAAGKYSGISMEAEYDSLSPASPDAGEALSQDDIDKLLAEFGT